MSTKRNIFAGLAMAIVLPIVAVAPMSAGASTPISAKSLAKDLLPYSFAKKAGFPKVARKVASSSKTGLTSCPDGARVTFESASNQTDLASEVVACTNKKAADALLKSSESGVPVPSAHPPARLGSSAYEQLIDVAVYQIVWRRGSIVEGVSLDVNVPASGGSTNTSIATPSITSAQQNVLSNAVLVQAAKLRG